MLGGNGSFKEPLLPRQQGLLGSVFNELLELLLAPGKVSEDLSGQQQDVLEYSHNQYLAGNDPHK